MPYGNHSATTGSSHSVRRVNTPYDLGALDVRTMLSMRGRLGAIPSRYPEQNALNRVQPQGFARTPFSPGAVDVRTLFAARGRLGQSLAPVHPMRSSRYPSRTGAVGSWGRSAIAGRYAANGGHRMGQVQEIATAASALLPTIDSISQLFGSSASGADAERQAKMYSYYEQAMTAPGSTSSVDAVVNLYSIAMQAFDPVTNQQQNNPQITRTYAQQALQRLSSQGWINVNSDYPSYTGIGASGVIYDPTGTSGTNTQTAVANRGLPAGNTAALGGSVGVGVSGSALLLLALVGVGGVLLLQHRG